MFASSITSGVALPPDDVRYVGQVVAQRTGLSQRDAEKRVAVTGHRMQAKRREAEANAKDGADKARKASAYAALWMFVSHLIGAFIASLAGTLGGGPPGLINVYRLKEPFMRSMLLLLLGIRFLPSS